MNKLKFSRTRMNGKVVYLAEPYKVVHYDWSRSNGDGIINKPHWSAYHRIYDKYTKSMLFGDSVEKIGLYRGKEYNTKEEAFEACQKHYENSTNH